MTTTATGPCAAAATRPARSGRDAHRAGRLRDDLVGGDEGHDRVLDLRLAHRDDLVDEVAVVERHVADPAGEAVGERGRGRVGEERPAETDRLAQRGRGLRLNRDDAHARRQRLHRGGDSGDEPAAADGHDDRGDVRPLLDHLEADRALAGGRACVLERVDEDRSGLALERLRRLDRVVVRLAGFADVDREALELADLRSRRGARDEERRRAARRRAVPPRTRRRGRGCRQTRRRRPAAARPRSARRGGTSPRAP